MAITAYIYNSFPHFAARGVANLVEPSPTLNVKLALLTSGYTFDATHTIFADVSTHQVAAGNGYTAGGKALAYLTSGTNGTWTPGYFSLLTPFTVQWSNLTKTFRCGILYVNDDIDGVVDPLVAYILFNNAPANISVTDVDWGLRFSAYPGLITHGVE